MYRPSEAGGRNTKCLSMSDSDNTPSMQPQMSTIIKRWTWKKFINIKIFKKYDGKQCYYSRHWLQNCTRDIVHITETKGCYACS